MSTRLRLVATQDGVADDERGVVIRAPQRPGDRHGPMSLSDVPAHALVAFARRARHAEIDVEVALSLALQHELAVSALRAISPPLPAEVFGAIDRAAHAAVVTRAVSGALAAYVRALAGPCTGAVALRGTSPVPLRVIERVDAGTLVDAVTHTDLRLAVAWERAAALAGMEMGEWATRIALGEILRS